MDKNTVFYTLGVYGLSQELFLEKILSNKIDTFIDIRRRRAVRGSEYSFVNSNRLQSMLEENGINYIHVIELSPTDEIRSIQKNSDQSKKIAARKRDKLDENFVNVYRKQILDKYDFNDLLRKLESLKSKRALFFCVEASPYACHRSIITGKLSSDYGFEIIHLTN